MPDFRFPIERDVWDWLALPKLAQSQEEYHSETGDRLSSDVILGWVLVTYCLGIVTRFGLVMAADSRTNAGVDYISTYQKLFDFSVPGERVILLCSAGNLSITQEVLTILRRDLRAQADVSLHTLPNMYEVARYVGSKVRQVIETHRPWLQQDKIDYQCSFLLGGQIRGEETCLYLIYSQGNFLQATPETPFLQIGETKYGKPILDRTLSFETPIEAAAKYALLSLDSTMKSNISVGPPLNIVKYAANSFLIKHRVELVLRDPFLIKIRKYWEASLRQAFEGMPEIEWQEGDLADISLLPSTSSHESMQNG